MWKRLLGGRLRTGRLDRVQHRGLGGLGLLPPTLLGGSGRGGRLLGGGLGPGAPDDLGHGGRCRSGLGPGARRGARLQLEELRGRALELRRQLLGGHLGAEDEIERDARGPTRLRRGERADHLAQGLEARVELAQPGVEVGQVERGPDAPEGHAAAHVLAQAVLLVLGEDGAHLRIQLQPVQRILIGRGRGGAHVRQPRAQLHRALGHDGRGLLARGLRQQALEHVQRLDEGVEHLVIQRQLAQPQPVQQILGLVAQLGDALLAEEGGEALERVRRPEDAVDEVRVRLLPALLIQHEQILAQGLEDLRALGDELRQCFSRLVHASFR